MPSAQGVTASVLVKPDSMASFLAQRSLRSITLKLPPELRTNAFPFRAFSSTPSRKLTLVDVAIAGPNAILNGIHAMGVPWYATLPLTAVLVRGTFVYYFSSLPARKQAQTKALLFPLINAKADMLMTTRYHDEASEIRESSETKLGRGLSYSFLMLKAKTAAMQQVCKPYGAPSFSARSLLNFGMLIAFTEAIRLKCGARDGLLPALLTPFQWLAQKADPERFPKPVEPELKDPVTVLAERLEAQHAGLGSAGQVEVQSMPGASRASEILNDPAYQSGTTTKLSPLDGMDSSGSYFDPSLMTEGLSWFTDLTAPDSLLVFPATLGITMLITATLRPVVGKRPPPTKLSKEETSSRTDLKDRALAMSPHRQSQDQLSALQQYFEGMQWNQRLGIFMSGIFFIAAMKMPVAILLYFVPSIALGWVQSRWLDIKYPMPQPIQKCSRPMWRKARREWIGQRE